MTCLRIGPPAVAVTNPRARETTRAPPGDLGDPLLNTFALG